MGLSRMSDACAVCGADDVWKEATLPEEWRSYLIDERALEPATGYYLLPACADCSERVTVQKEMDEIMGSFDDDSKELLDDLDPSALVDEAG